MRIWFITQSSDSIGINMVLSVCTLSMLVTDMMPIGYCIYCHNKIFSRLINYTQEYQRPLTVTYGGRQSVALSLSADEESMQQQHEGTIQNASLIS